MKKKHIIFDMDGTLSDTAQATEVAICKVSKQLDLPEITHEHIRGAMGLPNSDFFAYLYPDVAKALLPDIEHAVNAIENDMIKEIGNALLFPGVYDMLDDLSKKGYCLYIASTGSQKHVTTTLAACEIEAFFTGVSCGEPEKISMVKHIIAGRNIDEWMMIGDMYKDSEAARGNNILAIGAGFGYLAKEDHQLFDAVLWEPMDIYDYL